MDNEIENTGAVNEAEISTETATEAQPESPADAVRRALAGDDDGDATDAADAEPEVDGDAEAEGDGEEKGEGGEEGKEGELDLKTPEGLKAQAAERFQKLAEGYKEASKKAFEVEQKYQELETQHKQIVDVWEGTGASPEQFASVITLLTDFNSGDRSRMQKAYQMLDGMRANAAKELGIAAPGVDHLSDFPDLQQKVQAYELDEASAAEIAAARRRQSQDQQRQNSQQQTQQQQAQMAQRTQQAQQSLATMGEKLRTKDPEYSRKVEILNKRGFFDKVAESAPPESWGVMFQTAYEALGDVASASRVVAPKKDEQPLRRTGEGGGGRGHPKTVADAVRMALAE